MDFGTTLGASPPREGAARYFLAMVGEGFVHCAPLPEEGTVSLGRADTNQVWIDDPLISRQHALLHLGAGLALEDLGSANGTRLGGRKLQSGQRTALAPGQAFELGATMFVVQRRSRVERRRLWPHEYFELRVEEECQRRARLGGGCTVLWIRLVDPGRAPALEGALDGCLDEGELVARWVDGEYELLLSSAAGGRVEQLRAALADALGAAGFTLGRASYPRDGASASALLSAARGGPAVREEEPPIIASPVMLDLYRMVDKIARGKISALILGETGSGKEIVAEAIHRRSPRARGPLLKLNCAAFTESLLEAELFGYEKGAFTGADRAKPGLIEAADGGTLFLDEVGELPPSVQARLLRVLEQREVQRLGALKPRTIDVRFVSATHKDLEAEVLRGTFRQDLLFRLNGATLLVPPLRERREEIRALVKRFAAAAAAEAQLPTPRVTPEALAWLEAYDWPGNLRELKNVVERAVLLAGESALGLEELPVERAARRFLREEPAAEAVSGEAAAVLRALEACGGNQSRAAKLLGLSRRTLLRRLDELDVPRPRKGRDD